MKFEEYRKEIHALYAEYMKVSLQPDGTFLTRRLPAIHRPHYKSFELIVDLTSPPENILADIEELKTQILEARTHHNKVLSECFPDKMVISDIPKPKGRRSTTTIIDTVKKALEVYRRGDSSRLSVASGIFGFRDTNSDKSCKSAEREVRRYHEYAEMLLQAVREGTFFTAVEKPLPRNK